MRCLRNVLIVLMISIFLTGCQLYKEQEETFVPFEEIMVESGEEAGLATLDSLKETVSLEVKGLPVLDDEHIYEAWLVDDDIDLKISIGTFEVDDEGNHILDIDVVKEDILDTDSVIVTLETIPDEDSGPSDDIVLRGDTGGIGDIMSVKLEIVGMELPEEEILGEITGDFIELPDEEEVPEEEIEEIIEELVEGIPEEEIVEGEEAEEIAEESQEAIPEINILARSLEPNKLTIKQRTTVRWVNKAETIHIIAGAVKSPKLEKGDSFEYTFEDVGEYFIIDVISKATMNIIVTEAPEEEIVEEEEPEEALEDITGGAVIEIPGEETPEEAIPERIDVSGGAVVIVIQETEDVSLKTTARDPDADQIIYAYTSPLDASGEWQTTYGDAGDYTVTVTVSDGTLSASKDILIIVNKKEEAPVIDVSSPTESEIRMDEDTEQDFSASASDINKDELTYSWKLDDEEISTGKAAKFMASYDDAGTYTLKLRVSDGTTTVERAWKIIVINVNREPVLDTISDITIEETGTVLIEPDASDPDGDELTYTIQDPVGDDGEWKTTYDDAGEYTILVTVSDGVDSDTQEVKVTVENVNRPPVIDSIVNIG